MEGGREGVSRTQIAKLPPSREADKEKFKEPGMCAAAYSSMVRVSMMIGGRRCSVLVEGSEPTSTATGEDNAASNASTLQVDTTRTQGSE